MRFLLNDESGKVMFEAGDEREARERAEDFFSDAAGECGLSREGTADDIGTPGWHEYGGEIWVSLIVRELRQRYQVRPVADADMTELGDVVYRTDDLEDAKDYASGYCGTFGAAVVDTVEGTVDWGHGTSKLGESAPAVVDPL